jgi:hypothetical protein
MAEEVEDTPVIEVCRVELHTNVKIIYKGKSVLVICTIPIPYNIKGWNSGSHIGTSD